jgi:nucleoside-diphosphate-sugar epimerase
MKNILIIGGGGYVGTQLTFHLLKCGYKVIVLDNFVYGNQFATLPFFNDENYTLFNGDFTNYTDLELAAENATDVVILGGLVGDPITKSFPLESENINDIGMKKCIDFFDNKSLDKLIFVSTCSNYGIIGDGEVADENFELKPQSLYANAKVDAEKHLINKKGIANYTAVILRFATAFGLSPRMRFDLSISEFTRELFFDRELLVFDEHTWRPYCHVKDFSLLIEIVINSNKDKVNFEIFNAGGDVNNYTKKMILDVIAKEIPTLKIKYDNKGSDPRNYRVSFSKVKNVLNFEPKYTVVDGVKELINAFKIGLFDDSFDNKDKYGNYHVKYK